MVLGQRLKQTRKEKLLSIGKLSELSKVSSAYISQLENGHSQTPSYSIVFEISRCSGERLPSILWVMLNNRTRYAGRVGSLRQLKNSATHGACRRFPPYADQL